MKLSETQLRAVNQIKELTNHFGIDRKFVQTELPGIGANTLQALEQKGILKHEWYGSTIYYQVIEYPKKV